MARFFNLAIDATVQDLIPFFLPENSSCCEKALFVYGFYTYILSDYILVIIDLLDVTISVLYVQLKHQDEVIGSRTYIPRVT